ncbi:MAG: ParA family protein [Oscillatoriaceae bacterium SKW80]|nr:ParA family protein [Oscillatoriaceae bacterium SKYG93]MCX8121792.1 ParA family protein [Oscillatoriaceae bacterium SKW80]MDW8452553.1 ParA family protein [Oscillatoriaceae cyanobacterium SKYGB_i_bin93]HIK28656.1 ParA family protein [Oscillatoriaceae cyanobacterium M7585_C2015_266]
MPKIVAIINGKGGVGKTTTAINLAAVFSEKSRVLLVDAAPQRAAGWWLDRSQEGMGFELVEETNPNLLSGLRKIEGYELVIVDTPPALRSQALAAVLESADYVVLPTPCAPMDLAALIETVQKAVLPMAVAHRVLLTKVDSRSLGEALEAQNMLLELGIAAFHAFVRAYKAHERAALEGLSITKWRGKNAREAEADYRRVADELKRDWRE